MTDSTRTDPRFHPAYQRGYQGQGGSGLRADRAVSSEERFRRPRGGDSVGGRRRATAPEEDAPVRVRRPSPARLPSSSLPPIASPLPSGAAVVDPDQAPVDDVETETAPAQPRRPSALDRRVPIALAALGLLFLMAGLGLVWNVTTTMYGTVGFQQTEFDQFVSALTSYLAGPAITIGLLSVGAAIAVRVARS
ncbi:hypothetical protein [Rathayibacter sp. VKM Ac-2857]|uniref:hypothetical protein n=1 Tax=Rathayibacter sp. VKM Ac-2857 TaxID=2739020 RepID=UPI001567B3C7|nr:hypothetical protein [Rathayibacter sp. VKM Ac-2857]NQX16452.1 hypothetical protein [Rathayibacter sp. VKM Ac-2857]